MRDPTGASALLARSKVKDSPMATMVEYLNDLILGLEQWGYLVVFTSSPECQAFQDFLCRAKAW